MKGKSSKKGTTTATTAVVTLKTIQEQVQRWMDLRRQSHKHCHDLVNLFNHASYLTSNKMKNAFGEAVSTPSSLLMIHDDIWDISRALKTVQDGMFVCLEHMVFDLQMKVFPETASSSLPPDSNNASTMTYSCYCRLRDQMQQQTFLEMCIAQDLMCIDDNNSSSSSSSHSIDDNVDGEGQGETSVNGSGQVSALLVEQRCRDQDALTTMLACLAYPPYLRTQDLEAFIALTSPT